MLLSCDRMKAVEQAAFARGASASDLMESAGLAIARHVLDFFPAPGHALAVCGKGNNAGDVLVAVRHLAEAGWSFDIDLAFPESVLTALAAKKLAALRAAARSTISHRRSTVILDGLLGIGASGDPREPVASAIRRIHSLRENGGAFVVAADLPSGLDADTGRPGDPCVVADLTVAIGLAKTGIVADRATPFVGRLALAPLPELTSEDGDPASLLTPDLLRPLLPPRPFDSHKGTWGRVGIVAGSRGFLGAARLCSEAALRAGAGLVTLHAKADIYDLLAPAVAPEIMVLPIHDFSEIPAHQLDALAIGPGLGSEDDAAILDLIARASCPSVVDADALNALSRAAKPWPKMAGPRLFTPHPGEMERLAPGSRSLPRRDVAERYVADHAVTLLLKGARTLIAEHGRPSVYNTTGNPGMGSGGMGDVLTGVCAALMAAKHPPRDAAMLGAWLCGRAAEICVFAPGGSPESLAAGDVTRRLGAAFRELHRGEASAADGAP